MSDEFFFRDINIQKHCYRGAKSERNSWLGLSDKELAAVLMACKVAPSLLASRCRRLGAEIPHTLLAMWRAASGADIMI